MDIVVQCGAGADVHKKTVMVCVRKVINGKVQEWIKEFRTTTPQLRAMAEWLEGLGVTHVAMESTGVYWKPIWNMLEDRFELLLCNAQHIKKVPGRKTDVKDCQWIARLLQHGLLQPSFVPPRPIRQLRDLTRQRAQLTDEKTRIANRIQKILEDANVKATSVLSDILGVSGRAMLEALSEGEQKPEQLVDLARGRLRRKLPELREALQGYMTDHHRFLLRTLLRHLRAVEQFDAELSARIETLIQQTDAEASSSNADGSPIDASRPPQVPQPSVQPSAQSPSQEPPLAFTEAVQLLDTLPGVNQRAAQSLVAELGNNMAQFPDAPHLASWGKICPGNNRSAGKGKAAPTGKANRWLRRALGQAACSAVQQRKSYFNALYRRIAARRGKLRAQVAVAHSMIVSIYHMLTKRVPFHDLGADFFDRRNPEKLASYLVRRLERLGHHVTLQPQDTPV
jgi:transposase